MMPQSEDKKRGVYKNFISGGISASIARTMTNPIERVEILRQVRNVDHMGLNMISSQIKIVKTQGFSGLFKGNTASVVRVFPFSAIEFYSLEWSKNNLKHLLNTSSLLGYFVCGGIAGISAVTLTFPLDVARTRIAIYTENSLVKENRIVTSLLNLWKEQGIRGLYKGYSVASVGTVSFIAIKQTVFEMLKMNFMVEKYKTMLNFVFGTLAGIIGTCFLYPNYLLKRVLQANTDPNFSVIKYTMDVYKTKGMTGLYSGFSMTILKTGPYVGITFFCNEKLKELFKY